jgi:hypothetical protein
VADVGPDVVRLFSALAAGAASNSTDVFAAPQRDGSHDFDCLIGDCKAHVRRTT